MGGVLLPGGSYSPVLALASPDFTTFSPLCLFLAGYWPPGCLIATASIGPVSRLSLAQADLPSLHPGPHLRTTASLSEEDLRPQMPRAMSSGREVGTDHTSDRDRVQDMTPAGEFRDRSRPLGRGHAQTMPSGGEGP